MKSSLSFQLLLHLGSYYFGVLCISEVLLLIYKTIGSISSHLARALPQLLPSLSVLPYPTRNIAVEITIIILLILVESARIFAGWKGNLTENVGSMILSLALIIPGILGVVYFLVWQVGSVFTKWFSDIKPEKYVYSLFFQTYILRVELILCGVQLTIQGLQLIFSFICLITFYSF